MNRKPQFNGTLSSENFQKLKRTIEKQFISKKLIGDININPKLESELEHYFIKTTEWMNRYKDVGKEDPIYVTALIRFGCKVYDGRFWPHLDDFLFHHAEITTYDRRLIQDKLFKTLRKFEKAALSESEIVNTILMHGLVSDHYSKHLFDYLYRFYKINLHRNLNHEDFNDLVNQLVSHIQGDEDDSSSNREYMLNKQVKDAIKVTSKRSTAMKFRWILKYIDLYWRTDFIPVHSKSRLIKLLCNWLDQSEIQQDIVNYSGDRRITEDRVTIPYVIYNYHTNDLKLVIPGLNINSGLSRVYASVYSELNLVYQVNLEQTKKTYITVTNEAVVRLNASVLFKDLIVKIHTDESEIKKIKVLNEQGIVFFNSSGISARVLNSKDYYIKEGEYSSLSLMSVTSSSSVKKSFTLGSLHYTEYNFDINDYVVYDGHITWIRDKYNEDLTKNARMSNVTSNGLDVYYSAPSLIVKADNNQIGGIKITANDSLYFYVDLSITKLNEISSKQNIYLIDLNPVLKVGENVVVLDVSTKPKKQFCFSLLPGTKFDFLDGPYIFKENGKILVETNEITGEYNSVEKLDGFRIYEFDINDATTELEFSYQYEDKQYPVNVKVPCFRWGVDENNLSVSSLDQIWHADFNYRIFVSFPEKISFVTCLGEDCSNPIDVNSQQDKIRLVDLTKLKSMILSTEYDQVMSIIFIEYRGQRFRFADVFRKTVITSISLLRFDEFDKKIKFNVNYVGKDRLFLDLKLIAPEQYYALKKEVNTEEIAIESEGKSGIYELVIYKKEKGFLSSFEEIYKIVTRLITDNMTGLELELQNHRYFEKRINLIKYSTRYLIKDIIKIDINLYLASLYALEYKISISESGRRSRRVQEWKKFSDIIFEVIDRERHITLQISQLDDPEDFNDTVSIIYDSVLNKFVYEEEKMPVRQRYRRYKDLGEAKFECSLYDGGTKS